MTKTIPYFWIKVFCFICVLIQVKTKNQPLKALGHSALLISWDTDKHGNTYSPFLKFQAIPENNNNATTISEQRTSITSEDIDIALGQYQISTLDENTHYQINITDNYDSTCYIKGKTGLKTNFIPPKPKFKWIVLKYGYTPTIWITWLPCGNAKCEFVTSTHFSIRYKMLESKHWFESGDIYTGTYRMGVLYPGRIYEVTITSMNGRLKSDSYTEEIFVKPCKENSTNSIYEVL